MPTITTPNTGVELFYDTHGDPANPTILLVMGLGGQMLLWPQEFVDALVERGYHVVRYDNRDIGLSQKMEGARAPGLKWQLFRKVIGWPAAVPYSLKDMADDGVGLLDALGIERAHVVGASMGGMIVQLMAIHHADKLLSMTSIFSTTGSTKVPQADKEAMNALIAPLPSLDDVDALVAHGINVQDKIGSPGFPADPERLKARVAQMVQRSVYPPGLPRQLAAIVDDGDRTSRLGAVTTPTLVLHGDDDPLVKVEGGHATAAAIPGAKLVTIPGWGHDLPIELVDRVADEIAEHLAGTSAREPVLA